MLQLGQQTGLRAYWVLSIRACPQMGQVNSREVSTPFKLTPPSELRSRTPEGKPEFSAYILSQPIGKGNNRNEVKCNV